MTADRLSTHARHAEATRNRILDAAVTLVERGVEPTMRNVGKEAAVGERTVYRHFESHEALGAAVAPRFAGRSGIPLCATFAEIETYIRELFTTFETNASLVVTMLTSPWMGPHFQRSRAKNLAGMQKLIDDAFPKAPSADRTSAAASLRAVLSGSGWMYLRRSCALPNEDVIAHAIWLTRTVAATLRRQRKTT